MPSERVTQILRAKTTLSDEEIAVMTEAEGWAKIYENRPARKIKPVRICFTGFDLSEKEHLKGLAVGIGMKATVSVTGVTNYLCIGSVPGQSKVAKAKKVGAKVLTRDEFLGILEDGELP